MTLAVGTRPARQTDRPSTLVLAVASAAAFGTSGPFVKPLLEAGWSPASAVAVRAGFGGLVLLIPALIALAGRFRMLLSRWRLVVTYGIIAVVGSQVFYFAAIERLAGGRRAADRVHRADPARAVGVGPHPQGPRRADDHRRGGEHRRTGAGGQTDRGRRPRRSRRRVRADRRGLRRGVLSHLGQANRRVAARGADLLRSVRRRGRARDHRRDRPGAVHLLVRSGDAPRRRRCLVGRPDGRWWSSWRPRSPTSPASSRRPSSARGSPPSSGCSRCCSRSCSPGGCSARCRPRCRGSVGHSLLRASCWSRWSARAVRPTQTAAVDVVRNDLMAPPQD